MINYILPARPVKFQDKVIIGAGRAIELYFDTTLNHHSPFPSLHPSPLCCLCWEFTVIILSVCLRNNKKDKIVVDIITLTDD